MKRFSLIRRSAVLLYTLLLLVTALFAVYCALSFESSRRETRSMADSMLRLYCTQIDGELKRADTLLQNVVVERGGEIDLLQSLQERERYFVGNEIYSTLRSALQANPGIAMIAVYDNSYDVWYDAHQESNLSYWERRSLESFTKELLDGQEQATDWKAVVREEQAYLYRAYSRASHIAVVFLRADGLLPGADAGGMPITWRLLDADGTALAASGRYAGESDGGKRLTLCAPLSAGGFQLGAVLPGAAMFRQLQLSLVVMGLLIALLVVFSLLLQHYGRHSIIGPLRRITGQLQKMKDGTTDLYLEGDCDSQEFALLQDSFNRLMTDNVQLRLKSYQTRLETQGTELRCIRLQLRPHFFLNALTTISSLSMQGKNEEIKTYINALSRNVRYMFKSGLHTVPLEEELAAVKNYFEMQELKYPGTVFYMLQQEPGTERWPVPQMIIHTVLENEYKHAVSMGETLTILTEVSTVETDGEKLLSIAIEDDGKGYPAEVLDAQKRRAGPDGSRVGLSSIDRMLEIMYDRKGLMRLSNVEPHGAKTEILLPARPVNEYREELSQAG